MKRFILLAGIYGKVELGIETSQLIITILLIQIILKNVFGVLWRKIGRI